MCDAEFWDAVNGLSTALPPEVAHLHRLFSVLGLEFGLGEPIPQVPLTLGILDVGRLEANLTR